MLNHLQAYSPPPSTNTPLHFSLSLSLLCFAVLLSPLRLSSVSTCYSIVASLIASREGDNNNNNNNKSLAQWQRHKELRYSLIIIAACGMPRRTQRCPVRAASAAANQLDALPARPSNLNMIKVQFELLSVPPDFATDRTRTVATLTALSPTRRD